MTNSSDPQVKSAAVIDCDLNGQKLSQAAIDWIMNQVELSAASAPGQLIDIHIRRLSTTPPNARVIIDYGEIYEAVRILLEERDAKTTSS